MTQDNKELLLKLLQWYRELGISEQIDYKKFYLYSIITHSTAIEGYAPPTFGDEYHLNNRESMIYFFDRNSDLKTSLSIDTAKKILKR